MTTNPFYNAGLASAYIITLVSTLFYFGNTGSDEPHIIYPILALSLLTLSVAVMAYLFFYKPVLMLLDGKREEGVKLFLQTVGVFAVITFIVSMIALVVTR